MAHRPLFLAVPIPFFLGIALVVKLFTFGEGDFAFDQVFLPVKRCRHHCVPLLLHRFTQIFNLLLLEQQFAGANGIADKVGGHGGERLNLRAEQEGFAVFENHIAVGELAFARAKALDLPSGQGNARFNSLFKEVVEFGALIESDDAALGLVRFFV